jgi:hypothetical protein
VLLTLISDPKSGDSPTKKRERDLIKYRTNYWNIGPQQLVYNGELDGVTTAIEYASSIAAFGDHFDIYPDNQAGLYRLNTPSDHPGQACQIRSITAAQAIVDIGASITIN